MDLIITLILFAPISNMFLPLLTFVGAVQEKQEGPETVPPEPFKSHGNFLRFVPPSCAKLELHLPAVKVIMKRRGDYLSVPQMLQKQKTSCCKIDALRIFLIQI